MLLLMDAPAGMGKRALAPGKFVNCFGALVMAVKR